MPGAQRRGRGVRARSPVQRVDGRTRCLRRVAGARSGGRRADGRRRSSSARSFPRCVPPARAPGVGGRRALPQPPGDPQAARAAGGRPSARARARRPALERRRIDRADRGAAAAQSRCADPLRARLPAEPGARPPVRRARGALGPPDRARRAQRGPGGGAAGRSRAGSDRGHLPPRWRQPVLPRAARARRRGGVASRGARRQRSGQRRSRRRRGVARRGARVAVGGAARAAGCRRRRRRAVRARPRGRDRRAVRARRARRARRAPGARSRAAHARCRGASSSATRSCAARSSSRRRVAGSSPLTRAPRPRWPRAAPQPPSAPTTSSSPRARATRTPSRCSWTRA